MKENDKPISILLFCKTIFRNGSRWMLDGNYYFALSEIVWLLSCLQFMVSVPLCPLISMVQETPARFTISLTLIIESRVSWSVKLQVWRYYQYLDTPVISREVWHLKQQGKLHVHVVNIKVENREWFSKDSGVFWQIVSVKWANEFRLVMFELGSFWLNQTCNRNWVPV